LEKVKPDLLPVGPMRRLPIDVTGS